MIRCCERPSIFSFSATRQGRAAHSGTTAVNLDELHTARNSAVQQANRHADLRLQQSEAHIHDVARTAYSGVAMAMAAGAAGFQGYRALGLGLTYRTPNGQVLVNGALAYSGGAGTAARVQVGYEF